MPAAAVIPAPLAYTKVVAVKKLVVGYQSEKHGPVVFTIACQSVRASFSDLIQECRSAH